MNNPYLGLSSYTEASLKDYQFNGRTAAIAALTTLIRRNLFVTLYGRSGIGKTSLLQAGVSPLLRREGMHPVSLRLNVLRDGGDPAAKLIWANLSEMLHREGFKYRSCDKSDVYTPDFSDVLVFRKLFSAGRFLNDEGAEAIPSLVLDQFEEVLYNAPEAADLLIKQLYALIDDNYNLGVSHPCWHDDTNFRIVVSIREDDLFLFEDRIDSFNYVDLKLNRYRLMPMSEQEAKEVILKPIADNPIFQRGSEEAIADEIVRLSRGSGRAVNTLLLSLICYVVYDDCVSRGKNIAVADLGHYKDVIETYYKEVTKSLPKEQRYYIEDHLIDNQGRRTTMYLADLEAYAPQAKQLLENNNHRLLNENQGRVEFIHDQLAASVFHIRNTRKSKKVRRLGILALVLCLIGMLFFSLSRNTDLLTPSYKDAMGLVNDTESTSLVVNEDGSYIYRIYDCPSLKSIDIKNINAYLEVFNCPSLVRISYPEGYRRQIEIFNCPNVLRDSLIFDHRIRDSIRFEKYKSQYPDTENFFDSTVYARYFNYDSLSHKLIVKKLPIAVARYVNGIPIRHPYIIKFASFLPDSVKRLTDCYVPYGYKESFSKLVEYQPFRSIKELSVYYTCKSHVIGMFGYFEENKIALVFGLIAIFSVQCLFWGLAFHKYKLRYKNRYVVAGHSFIDGIGMSLLAVLSFMAFYWSIYDIIIPFNQVISIIVGALGGLICMFIVYKNIFYSLFLYFKSKGIRGLIKDLVALAAQITLAAQIKCFCNIYADRIRKIIRFLIRPICGALLLMIVVVYTEYLYDIGKQRRESYRIKLNEILDSGEYARAYSIIQQLGKRHQNILYPDFTARLDSIKTTLVGDSIFLSHRITKKYIEDLAQEHNISLNISGGEFLAMSEDASMLVVSVEQGDLWQAILVDIPNQSIDTLTPKLTFPSRSILSASGFSPSGNFLVISVEGKRYVYSMINKTFKDITNGLKVYGAYILMVSDSLYFISNNHGLYKGLTISQDKPILLTKEIRSTNYTNAFPRFSNLMAISPTSLVGTERGRRVIIYDIAEDTISFRSKHYTRGPCYLRYVNQNYAITESGLLDFASDSIINENGNLYQYKGQVVELQESDTRYTFVDLEGKEIVKLLIDDRFGSFYKIRISKEGNALVGWDGRGGISIYSLTPITERTWKISDSDKQFFHLK